MTDVTDSTPVSAGCEHTEHAIRSGGRYGRFFPEGNVSLGGEWEPCPKTPDTAATDDWPLFVFGSAQNPEIGNLQCGVCYEPFWSSDSRTTVADLRAATDTHRRDCKGADDAT